MANLQFSNDFKPVSEPGYFEAFADLLRDQEFDDPIDYFINEDAYEPSYEPSYEPVVPLSNSNKNLYEAYEPVLPTISDIKDVVGQSIEDADTCQIQDTVAPSIEDVDTCQPSDIYEPVPLPTITEDLFSGSAALENSPPPPAVNSRKIAKPRRSKNDKARQPGPNGLRFSSYADAMAEVHNRTMPSIKHDDWHLMKANPEPYIKIIIDAFEEPTIDSPRNMELLTSTLIKWRTYQEAHVEKVDLYEVQNPGKIELAAWMIFGNLIEVHEMGVKNMKKNATMNKCSEHLEEIVETIADYAIVRWDIIRFQRMEELVTSTHALITRKIANFNGNAHKRERDENNAKKFGPEYENVLGTRNREDGGEEDGEDEKFQQPAKRPRK